MLDTNIYTQTRVPSEQIGVPEDEQERTEMTKIMEIGTDGKIIGVQILAEDIPQNRQVARRLETMNIQSDNHIVLQQHAAQTNETVSSQVGQNLWVDGVVREGFTIMSKGLGNLKEGSERRRNDYLQRFENWMQGKISMPVRRYFVEEIREFLFYGGDTNQLEKLHIPPDMIFEAMDLLKARRKIENSLAQHSVPPQIRH